MSSENAMQYQIVDAPSIDALIKSVNIAIKGGWQPVGGVASLGTSLMQAMVFPLTKETKWSRVDWKLSDDKIAKQMGCSPQAVLYQRGKHELDRLVPAQKP